MSKDMADKAVETETATTAPDNNDVQDGPYWKMVQLESLLAALVNSKVVAIKANRGGKAFLRKPSDGVAPSSPSPDDLRYHKHHGHGRGHHGHHHHHHHHKRHHKHHQQHHQHKKQAALCKVKQWDDGSATAMVQLTTPMMAETDFCHGDEDDDDEDYRDDRFRQHRCQPGCRCHYKVRPHDDDRYVTVDMELDDMEQTSGVGGGGGQLPRRKRRKRQHQPMTEQQKRQQRQRQRYQAYQAAQAHQETKVKVVDPEDLPKRAKWTIIITAGFLLFTCMLLVGITLRMAPIIDQMVRNQNEELMNSLNRQDFNDSMMMA